MFILGGFTLLLCSFTFAEYNRENCPLSKCWVPFSQRNRPDQPTAECLALAKKSEQCVNQELNAPMKDCVDCIRNQVLSEMSKAEYAKIGCSDNECQPLRSCMGNVKIEFDYYFKAIRPDSKTLRECIACLETAKSSNVEVGACVLGLDLTGTTSDIITVLQAIDDGCPAEEVYNTCRGAIIGSRWWYYSCAELAKLVDDLEACVRGVVEANRSCDPVLPLIDRYADLLKTLAQTHCMKKIRADSYLERCPSSATV